MYQNKPFLLFLIAIAVIIQPTAMCLSNPPESLVLLKSRLDHVNTTGSWTINNTATASKDAPSDLTPIRKHSIDLFGTRGFHLKSSFPQAHSGETDFWTDWSRVAVLQEDQKTALRGGITELTNLPFDSAAAWLWPTLLLSFERIGDAQWKSTDNPLLLECKQDRIELMVQLIIAGKEMSVDSVVSKYEYGILAEHSRKGAVKQRVTYTYKYKNDYRIEGIALPTSGTSQSIAKMSTRTIMSWRHLIPPSSSLMESILAGPLPSRFLTVLFPDGTQIDDTIKNISYWKGGIAQNSAKTDKFGSRFFQSFAEGIATKILARCNSAPLFCLWNPVDLRRTLYPVISQRALR